MSEQKKITKAEIVKLLHGLNDLVEEVGSASTLHGLRVVTCGFAALLDIYAAPNAENPQGMCDDRLAFRQYFADLLVSAPAIKPRKGRAA